MSFARVPVTTDITVAADLLKQGKLVAIPTETVYGLAANVFLPDAIARIFEVKQRPYFNPLIVHIADYQQLNEIVTEVNPLARRLINAFWPGPLTVVLPKKSIVPDIVTAGLHTVAVRMPAHPLTLALLRYCNFPLAAPSANPFGYISPTSADHVAAHFNADQVAVVLDGGACSVGLESTIVGFEDTEVLLLRAGGITAEEIENVVEKSLIIKVDRQTDNPLAPGSLKVHYSPAKPMQLVPRLDLVPYTELAGAVVLAFSAKITHLPENQQLILSENGSVRQAAQRLFSALRQLDQLPGDRIIAELVPEIGIGIAINDRLRRAAAK
jgi:L-threonylcarbamoyladenylate synthase